MLATLLGLLAASLLNAQQPTPAQTRAVLARLGKEADASSAMRIVSRVWRRSARPSRMVRDSARVRGASRPSCPASMHEIVSEYGYISSDEPGGSLKEVRLVLTVDGLKWKRGKKDLSDLAGTDRFSRRKEPGSNAREATRTMDCADSFPMLAS